MRNGLRRHALLLIVLLAAVLRFAWLDAQSFWFDEFLTVQDIDRGFGDLLRELDELGEITPPLYFILAWAWAHVFGDGEVGLRSLSAALGTGTIPVLYAIARTISTERAGLYTAALGAVNPLLIWYSQEARSYALLVFLAALSLLFTVHATRDERPAWLLLWIAAAGLAVTTHYLAAALIIPEAVWLVLRRTGSRIEPIAAIGALAAVVVGMAPLIAEQVGPASWFDELALWDRLTEVAPHFLVGLSSPSVLPPLLAGVIVCAAIVAALTLGEPQQRRAVLLPGSIGVGGFALVLVGGAVGHDYLLTRNVLALWVPLAVAVGVALGAINEPRLRLASAAGLLTISLAASLWAAFTPAAQRADWRGVAEAVGEPTVDRVLLAPGWQASPLDGYLSGGAPIPPGEFLDRELVLIRLKPGIDDAITGDYARCGGFTWWGGVCTSRLAEPPSAPDGYALTRTGSAGQMEYLIYRAEPKHDSISTRGLRDGSAFQQLRP